MDVSPEEKQRIREKIEKLKQSKFKQQTLPAWRPVPTAMSTMLTFSVFSVIFLAIGIVLQVMSDRIVELDVRYDQQCLDAGIIQGEGDNRAMCVLSDASAFQDITKKVEGPVYVYYQLDNFYQNHRRYVKSRNDQQLAGKYLSNEDLISCDPIIKVGDLWTNQRNNIESTPAPLDVNDPAIPCGLVAKSYFNDTYNLLKKNDGYNGVCDCNKFNSFKINPSTGNPTCTETKCTLVDIAEDQIAWDSDMKFKFKNIEEDLPAGKTYEQVQWLNMKEEHFIVWMRTAGLPNFRKLWGRIPDGLDAGSYELQIDNQYQVAPFQGQKSFVLSTTNALGGKNYFLAVCYITVGTLCLLFAFVFCVAYMKKRNGGSNQGSN